jgi:TPR repeat protein
VARKNRDECSAGSMTACHAAALDAYYSTPTPETDRDAVQYFERACDAGYAPSCNGLGVMLLAGRGRPQDPAGAARLFRVACDAGVTTGCLHLADVLAKSDPKAAERARRRTECLRALAPDAGPASCPALSP